MNYYTLEEIVNKSAEEIVMNYAVSIQDNLVGTPLQGQIPLNTIANILATIRNYNITKTASTHLYCVFVQEYIKNPSLFTEVPFPIAVDEQQSQVTLYAWKIDNTGFVLPISELSKISFEALKYSIENNDTAQVNAYVDGLLKISDAEPVDDYDKELLLELFNVDLYTIPENPSVNLSEDTTSRFSGSMWFNAIKEECVVLAGLGGIGSWTALQLARAGVVDMVLYDNDFVELTNLSGQFYATEDVDRFKTQALQDALLRYAPKALYNTYTTEYTFSSVTSPIMICGFDNMTSRKTFYNKWKQNSYSYGLFIDGRLAAEEFQIYSFTKDNKQAMEKYEREALFTDEEADETPCSYKQTSFVANMIGSIITNIVVNYVANKVAGAPIRELPYHTYYNGSTMQFNIK